MRLDKVIIAILVFSAVIWVGAYLVLDVNTNYDKSVTMNKYNDSYNVISDVESLSNSLDAKVTGGNVSDEDTENSIFRGVYSATRLITGVYDFFGNIVHSIADVFNIPQILVTVAIVAFSIAIVFALIYLFIARSV